jgi:hypothetical protein
MMSSSKTKVVPGAPYEKSDTPEEA